MMLDWLVGFLRTSAMYARVLSGVGLVFLSFRVCWLTSAEAMERASQKLRPDGEGSTPSEQNATALETSLKSAKDSGHRPDIDKLQDLAGGEPDPKAEPSEPKLAQVRSRHLVVDLGPARSAVYVNGRRLGQTPFVGQIPCAGGSQVTIQVLPESGAPLVREVACRGTHLSVVEP